MTQHIPLELRERPQWVVWHAEWIPDKGKYNKIPFDAKVPVSRSLGASSTNAATWSTFERACSAYIATTLTEGPTPAVRYAGIGFVVSPDDPYVGIDIDDCITQSPDGPVLSPAATARINALATYTEVSPSGKGIRMFLRGILPPGGRKRGPYEMYDEGRFLTMTGRRWPGTPATIEPRQNELEAFHAIVFPAAPPMAAAAPRIAAAPGDLPADDELLRIAFKAANGRMIESLWGGAIDQHNNDHSAADLALATQLAFYTGPDEARLDRLFRRSGLMRDKWDEVRFGNGDTYGVRTVRMAIDGCKEFYAPPGSSAAKQKAEARREGARKEKEARRLERSAVVKAAGDLPLIECNDRHLRDVSTDALNALVAANDPPQVFVRSGRLVRIETNEKCVPSIGLVTEASLRHRLARIANFVSTSEDRGTVPVAPGATMVNDLMSFPSFGFVPPLEAIVTAPVVAPDGSLLTEVGYLPAARVYYDSIDRRAIPDSTPTPESIAAAKTLLLDEFLGDFPFADDAARAHAMALLLLPFVRPLISGNTPLHLVDAPTQGTGKTLLAQIVASVFMGRLPPGMRCPERKDDEEWRKIITSQLQQGSSHILFDNLRQQLDSASLAIALTSAEWTDRQLGSNLLTVTLPVRCAWTLTGNNINLGGDFPRRSVWIRLDSREERPENRDADAFRIPDIERYSFEERPKLLAAALTLIRAWLQAGRPLWSGKPVGGFTSWSRIMGGILEAIEIPGFLENREELYERADPEREQWTQFVQAWHERYAERAVGVADLIDLAVDCEIVGDDSRGSKNAFGRALRSRDSAIFAGFAITKAGLKDRAHQYKLNQWKQTELFSTQRGESKNAGLPKNRTPRVRAGEIHSNSFDSSLNEASQEKEEEGEEF
jgi:hypothetical protein